MDARRIEAVGPRPSDADDNFARSISDGLRHAIPRKSPANISMTRPARRYSRRFAPCRNITRPAPKWALLRRHAAEIAALIGAEAEGSWNSGRRRPAQGPHSAGRAQIPARLYPDRHFRRLSAGCGAPAGRRISPSGAASAGGGFHPAAAAVPALPERLRRGAPDFSPAAPSAISVPTRRWLCSAGCARCWAAAAS